MTIMTRSRSNVKKLKRKVKRILLMCKLQYANLDILCDEHQYEGAMFIFGFAEAFCPDLIEFLENPNLPKDLRYPCYEAGMRFQMLYGIITSKFYGEMKCPTYNFDKWGNNKN